MATKLETLYAKKIILCATLTFGIMGYLFLIANILHVNIKEYLALSIFAVLLIILTYLGLFSKYKNSNFMTVIFSACLLIIFIAEMSIALSDSTADAKTIKNIFVEKMRSKLQHEKKFIDAFQIAHACCGWKGPQDWNTLGISMPASCCAKNIKDNIENIECTFTTPEIHDHGCGIMYHKYYHKHSHKILQRLNNTKTAKNRTKDTLTKKNKVSDNMNSIRTPPAGKVNNKIKMYGSINNDASFRYDRTDQLENDVTGDSDSDNINNTTSIENSTEVINDYNVTNYWDQTYDTISIENSTEVISDYDVANYWDYNSTSSDNSTEDYDYEYEEFQDDEDEEEAIENTAVGGSYSGGGGGGGGGGRYAIFASLLG